MKYIVHTQLPPALSKHLLTIGFDCTHTFQYPKAEYLQDKEIVEIAINENRIIITKDLDFEYNYFLNGEPPKILRINIGNSKNDFLIKLIDHHIFDFQNLFFQNTGLIIINRDLSVTSF